MDKELYEVIPLEANLRSRPVLEPSAVLTRLKQGQLVTALSPTPPPPKGWLWVRADLQGTPVEGYIKGFLLKKDTQVVVPPPVLPNIPEASLRSPDPVRRNQSGDGQRVYELTEPNQPGRPGPTPTDRAQQLGSILSYLGVSHSARYHAAVGKTYCNIMPTTTPT